MTALKKNMNQVTSDNSVSVQADQIHYHGLSDVAAIELINKTVDLRLREYTDVALESVKNRVEEINQKLILKFSDNYPEGFQKFSDPDFQYALKKVQTEYARNGDEDLGAILVDLLIERSKHNHRSIRQIVLNEALFTSPKLTNAQLSILSIAFLFKLTINNAIGFNDTVGTYFDLYVSNFVSNLVKHDSVYQHLVYAGCGTILIGETLENILLSKYQGIFFKGFTENVVSDYSLSINEYPSFFCKCINDDTMLQVRALNLDSLTNEFNTHNVPEEDQNRFKKLFNRNIMNSNEVKEKCITIRPYMENLFDIWSNSALKDIQLTSVGIAIGHANIKRYAPDFPDLSIWIPE